MNSNIKRRLSPLLLACLLALALVLPLQGALADSFSVTELDYIVLTQSDMLSTDITSAKAYLFSDPDTIIELPTSMQDWFSNAEAVAVDESNAVVSPLQMVANGLEGGELLEGYYLVTFEVDGETYDIEIGPEKRIAVEPAADGSLTLLPDATVGFQKLLSE